MIKYQGVVTKIMQNKQTKIGTCVIENGLCLTHGESVSKMVMCSGYTATFTVFQEYNWRIRFPDSDLDQAIDRAAMTVAEDFRGHALSNVFASEYCRKCDRYPCEC